MEMVHIADILSTRSAEKHSAEFVVSKEFAWLNADFWKMHKTSSLANRVYADHQAPT